MADMKLLVTPEEVRNKSNQIRTKKGELENIMNNMQNLVNNLPNSWNSNSGRAYQEQYANVTRNVRKSLEVIETHARNLADAANSYEELEQRQQATVNSLSTDNIF